MLYQQFYVCNPATGAAIPGAQVSVYGQPTGALAAVYDQSGNQVANPLTADNTGEVAFAAADGTYRYVFTLNGVTVASVPAVQIVDGVLLSANLQAEISRAEAAEGQALGQARAAAQGLAGEVQRASQAEGVLATSISTETARALAAEEQIAGQASQSLSAVQSALNQGISGETSRARGAESQITGQIGAETSRARGVEAAIFGAIGANPSANPAFGVGLALGDLSNVVTQTAFTQTPAIFDVTGNPGFQVAVNLPSRSVGQHTSNARIGYAMEMIADGSGLASGPGTADYTGALSVIKAGYAGATVPQAGEIDVLLLAGRQDYGDIDALQINLGIVDRGLGSAQSGFASGIEGTTFTINPAPSYAQVHNIGYQLGAADPRRGNYYGLALSKAAGVGGDALHVDSTAGAGWTNSLSLAANGQEQLVWRPTDASLFMFQAGAPANYSIMRVENGGALNLYQSGGAVKAFSLDPGGDLTITGRMSAVYFQWESYLTVATLPPASSVPGLEVWVTGESHSSPKVFSDGTKWLAWGSTATAS